MKFGVGVLHENWFLASLSFMKIGSLTAMLYLKASGDVYPYFPRFIVDVGEIPRERLGAHVCYWLAVSFEKIGLGIFVKINSGIFVKVD